MYDQHPAAPCNAGWITANHGTEQKQLRGCTDFLPLLFHTDAKAESLCSEPSLPSVPISAGAMAKLLRAPGGEALQVTYCLLGIGSERFGLGGAIAASQWAWGSSGCWAGKTPGRGHAKKGWWEPLHLGTQAIGRRHSSQCKAAPTGGPHAGAMLQVLLHQFCQKDPFLYWAAAPGTQDSGRF